MAETATPPPNAVVVAETVESTVAAQYAFVSHYGTATGFSYGALAVSGRLSLPPGLAGVVGGRFGFGEQLRHSVAVEGFVMLLIEPRLRTLTDDRGRHAVWRPSAGIEVGATSAKRVMPEPVVSEMRSEQPSTFYGGFVAMPARFRVNHVSFGVLGLNVATSLDAPARIIRFQLSVVEFGWAF